MSLGLIFLLAVGTQAINFYLLEGTEKCFIMDLTSGSVILGEYNLIDPPPADAPETANVSLKVTDPTALLLITRAVRGPGKFSFTSQVQGPHRICITSPSGGWFGSAKKSRFSLKLDTTDDNLAHDKIVSKEEINHLKDISTQIVNRLQEVEKGQEYSREKEAKFRDESEDINSRIMWFTIFQTLVILVAGVWQILSLRSFFISRKIY
jgi:hypothetical protein